MTWIVQNSLPPGLPTLCRLHTSASVARPLRCKWWQRRGPKTAAHGFRINLVSQLPAEYQTATERMSNGCADIKWSNGPPGPNWYRADPTCTAIAEMPTRRSHNRQLSQTKNARWL